MKVANRISITKKQRSVMRTLMYTAHERNLTRLDMKPGNIIVTPENELYYIDTGYAVRDRPMNEVHDFTNFKNMFDCYFDVEGISVQLPIIEMPHKLC
ncbi:MAG: hypothetical protein ABIF40_01630 [archaeon]